MPDPHLEIRGGGGRGRGAGGWGETGLKNNFFRPFGPQFGLKIGAGGSPGSDTDNCNEMARGIDNAVQRKIK